MLGFRNSQAHVLASTWADPFSPHSALVQGTWHTNMFLWPSLKEHKHCYSFPFLVVFWKFSVLVVFFGSFYWFLSLLLAILFSRFGPVLVVPLNCFVSPLAASLLNHSRRNRSRRPVTYIIKLINNNLLLLIFFSILDGMWLCHKSKRLSFSSNYLQLARSSESQIIVLYNI